MDILKLFPELWSVLYTILLFVLPNVLSLDCDNASRPSDEDLRNQYSSWLQDEDDGFQHESFQLNPHYFHKIQLKMRDSFAKVTDRRTYLSGNRRCPRKLPTYRKGNYVNTCPHYTVMSVDFHRYPTFMATAQCACTNCYNSSKLQPVNKGKRRTVLPTKCVEIPYRFKVLKRSNSCQESKSNERQEYKYYETYETLSVGCTCALNNDRVAPSPKRKVLGD